MYDFFVSALLFLMLACIASGIVAIFKKPQDVSNLPAYEQPRPERKYAFAMVLILGVSLIFASIFNNELSTGKQVQSLVMGLVFSGLSFWAFSKLWQEKQKKLCYCSVKANHFLILFAVLGLLGFSVSSFAAGPSEPAQTSPTPPKQQIEAIFKEEISDFEGAKLEDPLPVHLVYIDNKLKAFQPGKDDPKSLLNREWCQIIHPITYKGQFIARTVTVGTWASKNNGWLKISSNTSVTKLYGEARAAQMKATGLDSSKFFAVSVPGLMSEFLAYEEKGELFLVPLWDMGSFNLKGGKPVKAAEVFKLLQEESTRLKLFP